MSVLTGQPRQLGFGKRANPGSASHLAFAPKVVTVQKTITGTGTDDFWVVPAGVFIERVFARCEEVCNGTSPTVTLGTDSDSDALINSTDFSVDTADNWATNVGSTTAPGANGIYFPSGDTLRIEVAGTSVTEGKVQFTISFFEVDDMFNRAIHFDE